MSALVEKIETLARIAGWPGQARIDPTRWLEQFEASDRPYAEAVGLSLTFVPEQQFLRHLRSGILRLRSRVRDFAGYPLAGSWESFLENARFAVIDDRRPSSANSGALIARFLRDEIGIDERRIGTCGSVTKELAVFESISPLVLIDDFLGSGDQFVEALGRQTIIDAAGKTTSLEAQRGRSNAPWVFLPVFATEWGIRRIRSRSSQIAVETSVVLSKRDSWRRDAIVSGERPLHAAALAFIERTHRAIGLRQNAETGALGYRRQGLALAFNHGVPDATLPLLSTEIKGYHPLISRSSQ